jgi:hypothetical protein
LFIEEEEEEEEEEVGAVQLRRAFSNERHTS